MMNTENTKEKKPPLTKAQLKRKRCKNCSLSLGLWLLFGLAVTKIIMGAEFGCSLDNKVIIYLVISGGVILLTTVLFIALIIALGAERIFSKKMKKLTRVPIIVCLLHLPWLIVGSVWGFRNLKDVLDGCTGECCDGTLVFFAVSTVVIDWILTILTIVSIHYMDISKKEIISLFIEEPAVDVMVAGKQNEVPQTDDEKINKEQPILFDNIDETPVYDQSHETHLITSRRGTPSAVRKVTSDVTNTQSNDTVTTTPVQTFTLLESPRPSSEQTDNIQTMVSFNLAAQTLTSNLPNLAEPTNDIQCDLLPSARDIEASKKKAAQDAKTAGNQKGKGKNKKNKKA